MNTMSDIDYQFDPGRDRTVRVVRTWGTWHWECMGRTSGMAWESGTEAAHHGCVFRGRRENDLEAGREL